MGFATVKSDPYKAGLRPRRSRSRRRPLWSARQWRALCRQAWVDDRTFNRNEYPLSDRCVDMIRQFNEGE